MRRPRDPFGGPPPCDVSIRDTLQALADFADEVTEGIETAEERAHEIEAEFSHTVSQLGLPELRQRYSTKQGVSQKPFSHTNWTEISPGVFARPTPRERIIRRVRRAD